MSGRDGILGRIRRSLGREALPEDRRAALEQRLADPAANLIPERAKRPHPQQVELFMSMATELDTTVRRVSSLEEVPAAVAEFLAAHNLPPRLRLSPDPGLDRVPWSARPLLEISRGPARADDLVSVTPAFAAVAETGTLVMASGPQTPATLNFLPDNHVVVLHAGDVVGAYEDAFARLRRGAAADSFMPRTLNMITGPSRTGDIEQELIVGAHGPRRLHVVLVDGEDA